MSTLEINDRISGRFVVKNPSIENLKLFNEHWEKEWDNSDLQVLSFVFSNIKPKPHYKVKIVKLKDLLLDYERQTGFKPKYRVIQVLITCGGFAISMLNGGISGYVHKEV